MISTRELNAMQMKNRQALFCNNDICGTQSAGNQRFVSTHLVGSSETIRTTPYSNDFCEWLAGVIDGDGHFEIGKTVACVSITMGLEDLPLLMYIKTKLGGVCKLVSGKNAYRFYLRDRNSMINLANCVNGNIRNSIRLNQFHNVCSVFNIDCLTPYKLTPASHWFGGFFDADGTITFSIKHGCPQLSIRATNKYLCNVQFFPDVLGGTIYFDKSQNGYYSWSIQGRDDVNNFYNNYYKTHTFRSRKSKRFTLIDKYWELRDLDAFKVESPFHSAWQEFVRKWKFEDKDGEERVQPLV